MLLHQLIYETHGNITVSYLYLILLYNIIYKVDLGGGNEWYQGLIDSFGEEGMQLEIS